MATGTGKSNIRMIFSQNLYFLMKQKGVTRRGLSKDLDIKYTTLCDWVNARTIPREDQLDGLSRYFGIEAGEFFIDFERNDAVSERKRLGRYLSGTRRLDMNVLEHMSDEQIRDLIDSGFFRPGAVPV